VVGNTPTLVLVTGPPGTGKSTLAEAAAARLQAAVLSWDWAMAALRPVASVQRTIEQLDRAEHRRVGWGILWNLATLQLRQGRGVVLDGTARQGEVDQTRSVATAVAARSLVLVTSCGDRTQHRQRIEDRSRDIPGWYEPEWRDVVRFLEAWERPTGADLYVDTADPLDACTDRVVRVIDHAVGSRSS